MEHNVQIQTQKRYRVNVSTSVKGQKTYDVTVDCSGLTMEEIVADSDKLVAQMDKRYPPPTKGEE